MNNNWSLDKENEYLEEKEEPGKEQLDLRRKTSFMNCLRYEDDEEVSDRRTDFKKDEYHEEPEDRGNHGRIRHFRKSHDTVHFVGLFALKQWISSSLKHDTVPRVIIKLHCFNVKNLYNVLHYGMGK